MKRDLHPFVGAAMGLDVFGDLPGPLLAEAREQKGATLGVKEVPAEVCDKCVEAALEPDVSRELTRMLDAAVEAGAETLVRHYEERVPA